MFDLLKTNRVDWIVALVTFVSAFVMKLDYAIFLWIILSLVLFLYKTINPRINEISKEEKSGRFKNIEKYKLQVCPQIMIIKPEMSLYFANAEWVLNRIMDKVKKRKKDLKFLVLDFESINYFDASAVEVLNIFIDDLKEINIFTYLINVNWKILSTFKNSELHYIIDDWNILDWKKDIITKIYPLLDSSFCKTCPVKIFNECKKI